MCEALTGGAILYTTEKLSDLRIVDGVSDVFSISLRVEYTDILQCFQMLGSIGLANVNRLKNVFDWKAFMIQQEVNDHQPGWMADSFEQSCNTFDFAGLISEANEIHRIHISSPKVVS